MATAVCSWASKAINSACNAEFSGAARIRVCRSVSFSDSTVSDNRVSLTIVEGLGHGFLNRSHLDDGPPRVLTSRTHVPGRGEQVVQWSGHVFAMIEDFFRTVLL